MRFNPFLEPPSDVEVEIPRGTFIKGETEQNRIIVNRILDCPYPENYGFYNKKGLYSEDGDLKDCFLISKANLPISEKAICLKKDLLRIAEICYRDTGLGDSKDVCVFKSDYPLDKPLIKKPEYYNFYKRDLSILFLRLNYLIDFLLYYKLVKTFDHLDIGTRPLLVNQITKIRIASVLKEIDPTMYNYFIGTLPKGIIIQLI